jgi:hypothetical protein
MKCKVCNADHNGVYGERCEDCYAVGQHQVDLMQITAEPARLGFFRSGDVVEFDADEMPNPVTIG